MSKTEIFESYKAFLGGEDKSVGGSMNSLRFECNIDIVLNHRSIWTTTYGMRIAAGFNESGVDFENMLPSFKHWGFESMLIEIEDHLRSEESTIVENMPKLTVTSSSYDMDDGIEAVVRFNLCDDDLINTMRDSDSINVTGLRWTWTNATTLHDKMHLSMMIDCFKETYEPILKNLVKRIEDEQDRDI